MSKSKINFKTVVLGIVFVFVGILIQFFSDADAARYEKLRETHTEKVEAYVVEVDEYRNKKDKKTYYNVTWGFDVNNEHYEVKSYKTFKTSEDATTVIWYVPGNPEDNYIEYEATMYQNEGATFFPKLLMGLGVFICITGLGFFKKKK